jgi:predicted regulator of Ras-like GTPase activity (Roadblock/LC7/MglB family)
MFAETLREIATRLVDVDAIFLMGLDGLPIEKIITNETLNIELLIAEFTTILRNTMQTSKEVQAGNLQEFLIMSDRMTLLLKAITEEYFLLLILPADANLGRARFELKKARYVLEKEFV